MVADYRSSNRLEKEGARNREAVAGSRLEVGGFHQFAKVAQRLAAMGDGVLLVWRQLGGGLACLVNEEEGVVSEAVGAFRRADDAAFDRVARGEEDAAGGVGERKDADEARGAFIVGDIMELSQQQGVVVV